MRRRSISQQSIARHLRCSQALVSFALKGKRVVDRKSYRCIWECAIGQGYRANGMEEHGSPITSKWVAILSGEASRALEPEHGISQLCAGLRDSLARQGLNTLLLQMGTSLDAGSFEDRLIRNNLFGAVILGHLDESFVRAVLTDQRNVIAIGASFPGLCHSVMANEREALDLLVAHLTALGHRRFAWIGSDTAPTGHSNGNGKLDVILAQHGLRLVGKRTAPTHGTDRQGGRKAAELLLDRCQPQSMPTAWICQIASLARGILNLLAGEKKRATERLGIVALDATPICDKGFPRLTGANTDPVKLAGKVAVILLRDGSPGHGSLTNVVLPAPLNIRESSGAAIGKPRPVRSSRR